MDNFENEYRNIHLKWIYAGAILLFLIGMLLTFLGSLYKGVAWLFLEHIGIFLSATGTVSFVYEIWVKKGERKIFLNDLKNTIKEELNKEPFERGRRLLEEKVRFISSAKTEVIEMGEKLNAFTGYFTSQPKHAFKDHIEALLKRSVTIKCFICDPDSEIVIAYSKNVIHDRNSLPTENIKESINKLLAIRDELKSHPGKIEIYKYMGVMRFHLAGVDLDERGGKMYISNYLNGVSRADCPGFELYNEGNKEIFKIYKESYDYIVAHSVRIP